jgi:hypothetical protein
VKNKLNNHTQTLRPQKQHKGRNKNPQEGTIMAAKKNKGIKGTAGNNTFAVHVYADMPVVSDRKMQVQLEEMTEEYVILTMRQPRSSKRIKRLIPRDDFVAFSYNEDSGEVSFVLPVERQEVMTVVGAVELNGGYVYVTEEDGTVHIFHEEDTEIVAEAEPGKKAKKPAKGGKKPGKRGKVQEDEDEDDEDEDEDEDDDESDSDDDDSDDDDSDDSDDEDEDDDESDSDEDEDDDESDSDDDEDEEDEDDEDDESDDSDDDDDDEDEDEDEDEEEEAPRGRRGKGRGRK